MSNCPIAVVSFQPSQCDSQLHFSMQCLFHWQAMAASYFRRVGGWVQSTERAWPLPSLFAEAHHCWLCAICISSFGVGWKSWQHGHADTSTRLNEQCFHMVSASVTAWTEVYMCNCNHVEVQDPSKCCSNVIPMFLGNAATCTLQLPNMNNDHSSALIHL